MIERTMQNECDHCKHRRPVLGNYHIRCVKPDPGMTGKEHGIRHGWFSYPACFDPIWKTKMCSNFESASNAVSGPVSRENDAVPIND